MDRPIPRYLDYLISVSAASITLPPQRERDALLLRAIRLQSFGPMRLDMVRGERPDEGVCTGTDIPLSHNVGADMHG